MDKSEGEVVCSLPFVWQGAAWSSYTSYKTAVRGSQRQTYQDHSFSYMSQNDFLTCEELDMEL